jgi:hypothetical protein
VLSGLQFLTERKIADTAVEELWTAVRVSELDGILTPQPLTLRVSRLKAPRGAFACRAVRA